MVSYVLYLDHIFVRMNLDIGIIFWRSEKLEYCTTPFLEYTKTVGSVRVWLAFLTIELEYLPLFAHNMRIANINKPFLSSIATKLHSYATNFLTMAHFELQEGRLHPDHHPCSDAQAHRDCHLFLLLRYAPPFRHRVSKLLHAQLILDFLLTELFLSKSTMRITESVIVHLEF